MALATNLVSHYKFDESSGNAADSVGSNTLTNTGTVTFTTGKLNNGATIANTKYFATAGTAFSYGSGSAFSFNIWVNSTSLAAANFILSNEEANPFKGYNMSLATDGKLSINLINNFASARCDFKGDTVMTTNRWYMVTFTYDGTANLTSAAGCKLYVDGKLQTLTVSTNTLTTQSWTSTSTMFFGARHYDTTQCFVGMLDEGTFWSRAITADEVLQMHNSGRANAYPFTDTPSLYGGVAYWKYDESSGNAADSIGVNTGTNNGTVTYAAGKVNNAAHFVAASSQYFNTPWKVTPNGTIVTWIKTTQSTAAEIWGNEVTNEYHRMNLNSSAGKASIYILSGGVEQVNITGTTTVNDGNWHMLAFVWGTGGAKLYVDGNSTPEATSASTSYGNSTIGLQVGVNYNNGSRTWYYSGDMDEMGAWSRALSTTELSVLYASGSGLQYPWAVAAAGPTNLKSYNTNLKANIKSIDGNLIANIKSLDTNA
jgi:hypothetical protein